MGLADDIVNEYLALAKKVLPEVNIDVFDELKKAELNGHSYIEIENLQSVVETDYDDKVRIDEEKVYLTYLFYSEIGTANNIRRLLGSYHSIEPPSKPTEGPLIPNDSQWRAIKQVMNNRISAVCGYPGTGKTTLIKLLLDIIDEMPEFDDAWNKYLLAAPTGKAARRLSEATGRDATTIHRLLGYHPKSGWTYNDRYPLDAKFIIIDEASMVDIVLANALLKAIPNDCHIVFIGDAKQLPPVKAGRFFEDLLDSEYISTTRLTQIFRQARQSLIIRNAHRIIKNEVPYSSVEEAVTENPEEEILPDFFFIEEKPGNVKGAVRELVSQRLPESYKLDPNQDILTLSPSRKGPAGLDVLNEELRKAINPGGLPTGIDSHHLGDRIIQTKNDYTLNILNGEIGMLEDYDLDECRAFLNFGHREIWVPDTKLSTFLPAFAISVHRSQGSQSPAVVVVMDKYHGHMLNASLLNTAITRAQMLCIIVGQWDVVAEAAQTSANLRRSHLKERIAKGV